MLTVNANLAMPAADGDVYDSQGNLNLSPGQAAAWDPTKLKFVDGTSIPEHGKITFAVGHDSNGDGIADTFREMHGGPFIPCSVFVGVTPPVCGQHNVKHFFANCIQPGVEYGIRGRVTDDDSWKTQGPYPRWTEFGYTRTATTDDCGQCTGDVDKAKFMCELAKGLDQNSPDTVKFFPTFRHQETFTITPVDGEFDDISEVTTDGGTTPISLNNTTKPGDATKSLYSQLDVIVSEINRVLDGSGAAYIIEGIGEDCPIKLVVMSCYAEGQFTVTGYAGVYADLFADITIPEGCKSCGGSDGTFTPAQGITMVSVPVRLDCGCEVTNRPVHIYEREVEIFGTLGFKDVSTQVIETQEVISPENHGYHIQLMEYYQENGGNGREYDAFSAMAHGNHPVPDDHSRAKNAVRSDCQASYCVYGVTSNHAVQNQRYSPRLIPNEEVTRIVVKKADTVAQASVEAFWNNLRTSTNGCLTYGVLDCIA